MHFYILISQDKKWVSEWFEQVRKQTPWLRSIEASNPWRLVWRLLRGHRVATQEEIRDEYSISTEEFEEYETQRAARVAANEDETPAHAPRD